MGGEAGSGSGAGSSIATAIRSRSGAIAVRRLSCGSSTNVDPFARAAGAERLVLFHHDPSHADHVLERLRAQAETLAAEDAEPPLLASEGLVLDVH